MQNILNTDLRCAIKYFQLNKHGDCGKMMGDKERDTRKRISLEFEIVTRLHIVMSISIF